MAISDTVASSAYLIFLEKALNLAAASKRLQAPPLAILFDRVERRLRQRCHGVGDLRLHVTQMHCASMTGMLAAEPVGLLAEKNQFQK
jgi:hypothetical protein